MTCRDIGKKRTLFFTAIILLIFCFLFFYLIQNGDSWRFKRLCRDFFAHSLSQDSLSLHYTLANPHSYLDPPDPATLPSYSSQERTENSAALENLLAALKEIDPKRLDTYDHYLYSLLLPYLENELTGARCEYFEEPLSPSSGMHIELPVLLAEYTFRTRQDLEDYMALLEDIPAYLESLAQYEREKSNAGLFMTQADAELVIEQCDNILDPTLLDSGEHFLQTTFRKRLEGLIAAGEVDEAEKERYLTENDRLLRTVALPAYIALADQIFLLSDTGTLENGLACCSGGTQYYTYLLKHNTGSSRTPEEIQELLASSLQACYEEVQLLIADYRQLTGTLPDPDVQLPDFPFADEQAILDDLTVRMEDDFPSLSSLTDQLPSCRTETVAESMEAYTSPAFYLTPPMDEVQENVIYVNQSSTAPGLELYTTLAHEGYPGHLYQTVYSQLYENAKTDNPVRNVLYYGGFVEGWAYYVENLAYGYAADVLTESGASEADALLVQLRRLERNLQVNLYCLLDLAIHYYGAGREDVYRTLAAFGLTNQNTADAIFDYIRREPTTYLKYYLGYLEILSLQEKAEEHWGKSYTPLRFHTFLLQAGPSDFTNLEDLLMQST